MIERLEDKLKTDCKFDSKFVLIKVNYECSGKTSLIFQRNVYLDIPCPSYKGYTARINECYFRDLGKGIDECPHCKIGLARKRHGQFSSDEIVEHGLTSTSSLKLQGIRNLSG